MTDKLCHLMDSEKDIKKLCWALILLQLVKILLQLGTVSVNLIEKCFQKAGFICSIPTSPDAEPELPRNIWDNMQQVLKVQVPFADYATADDAVEDDRKGCLMLML